MKFESIKVRLVRWAEDTVDSIRTNWRSILMVLAITVFLSIFVVYATLVALDNELAESSFFTSCWGIAIGGVAMWILDRYKVVSAENARERYLNIIKTRSKELNDTKRDLEATTDELQTTKEELENAKKEIAHLNVKLLASIERTECSVEKLHEHIDTIGNIPSSTDALHANDAEGSNSAPSEPTQTTHPEPKKGPDFTDVDAIFCIFRK